MKITVKLFATLQRDRFIEKGIEIAPNKRVADVLADIGINPQEAAIIFINGIHGQLDSALKEGDVLALFPPIGGG
jgi:molybdopterin synthase sulfur carrier subunit